MEDVSPLSTTTWTSSAATDHCWDSVLPSPHSSHDGKPQHKTEDLPSLPSPQGDQAKMEEELEVKATALPCPVVGLEEGRTDSHHPPPVKPRKNLSFSNLQDVMVPVRLDLRDVCFRVKSKGAKGGQVPILQNVNLTFTPGEFVGIMGPSGSGKTSLLSILHGDRHYFKGLEGSVTANGTPIKKLKRSYRKICSFVPQDDILLPTFTVLETMMFAAQLRLPYKQCLSEKRAIVHRVLEELGILECAHVVVGSSEKRGISGGQRRRLSICLELLVDPSLDSKTTEDLCTLLSHLAGPGRCIISTIHQPSYMVFQSFDKMCLLTRGQVAYYGRAVATPTYFTSRGYEIPMFENPADFFMRVLQREPELLIAAWKHHNRSIDPPLGQGETLGSYVQPDKKACWLKNADLRENPGWWQFLMLFSRMMKDSCKDRGKLLSGIVMESSAGVVVGLVWYKQDIYTQKSVFPLLGVFIMLTTIAIFDQIMGLLTKFPTSRGLHFREFKNGYYSLLPYYSASLLSSIVLSSIYQTLQAIIVFFMVGLEFTPAKFVTYLIILALAGCIGANLGFVIGVFTSDLKRTQQVLTPVLLPMMLFSGYMLPYPMIPSYLRWMFYCSIYQWIYSALVVNHFRGLVFRDCPGTMGGGLSLPGNYYCQHTGEDVLAHTLSLDANDLSRDVFILVAVLGMLSCLGYAVLRYKSS